ncbi:MAG: recombinase family protein [Oscillospiraceae bacterium]|nr:recombinase family protein [Oscillospiraceae bacterium]
MSTSRNVIVIPAKPELQRAASIRQQRVAAYCRVSDEEEEQQSSYQNQCNYYTDLIMKNPNWSMAGIYAEM